MVFLMPTVFINPTLFIVLTFLKFQILFNIFNTTHNLNTDHSRNVLNSPILILFIVLTQLIAQGQYSIITQQFTYCQLFSQQFIFPEQCIQTRPIQHIGLSNPISWHCVFGSTTVLTSSIMQPNKTVLLDTFDPTHRPQQPNIMVLRLWLSQQC